MTRRIKILIVDDDTRNARLLKRFIEAEGFETQCAANGREGLEMYESYRPDLILLDINMPVMDGFEMAAEIRRTDKRVIIFFLTDRTQKSDRLHGFSLKGNDYIPKPFYPEEIVAKINERLDSLIVATDTVYEIGQTVFRPNISTLTYRGQTSSLSVRQAEILTILAENQGKVVERDAILNAVWGDASYSNSMALNVQITYLRRLLADPSVSIVSLKKRGYMLTVC